jgi:hypothetical protein
MREEMQLERFSQGIYMTYVNGCVEQLVDDVVGVRPLHELDEAGVVEAEERGEHAGEQLRPLVAGLHHVAPDGVEGQVQHVRHEPLHQEPRRLAVAALQDVLHEVVATIRYARAELQSSDCFLFYTVYLVSQQQCCYLNLPVAIVEAPASRTSLKARSWWPLALS